MRKIADIQAGKYMYIHTYIYVYQYKDTCIDISLYEQDLYKYAIIFIIIPRLTEYFIATCLEQQKIIMPPMLYTSKPPSFLQKLRVCSTPQVRADVQLFEFREKKVFFFYYSE